ncbi:unnamed protein product, partial [Ostreobium quekettii]
DYDSAKARGSADPKVDFRRGQVLHKLGRAQEAAAAWRAAAGGATLDTDVEILCSIFAALKDPNSVSAQACGPLVANGSAAAQVSPTLSRPLPETPAKRAASGSQTSGASPGKASVSGGTMSPRASDQWRPMSRVMDPDSAVQKAVEQ